MLDIVPALAEALGQLRRGPGNDTGWVDGVLRTLERKRSDDYDRLRRRLGFARRLADLVGLSDEERATLTVGLFFAGVVDASPSGSTPRPARAWMEYLLRNEDWLAPSLQLAQLPGVPDPDNSTVSVVAATTVIFDAETLMGQSRPLQVIKALKDEATSPAAERVAEMLWSEEGQELCDWHVRHRGRRYRLESSHITDSMKLLKPAFRRSAPEPSVEASLRLSGTAGRSSKGNPAPASDPESGFARAISDNFERRKRALRSGSGHPDEPSAAGDEPQRPVAQGQPVASATSDEERTEGPAADPWRPSAESATPEAAADTGWPGPEPEEDQMQIGDSQPGNPETIDNLSLARRLEELRIQLQQISRVAAEGHELLASLAPQLEEFTTWMAELETMVSRWKAHPGAGGRAA